jgi:hypothetical protein
MKPTIRFLPTFSVPPQSTSELHAEEFPHWGAHRGPLPFAYAATFLSFLHAVATDLKVEFAMVGMEFFKGKLAPNRPEYKHTTLLTLRLSPLLVHAVKLLEMAGGVQLLLDTHFVPLLETSRVGIRNQHKDDKCDGATPSQEFLRTHRLLFGKLSEPVYKTMAKRSAEHEKLLMDALMRSLRRLTDGQSRGMFAQLRARRRPPATPRPPLPAPAQTLPADLLELLLSDRAVEPSEKAATCVTVLTFACFETAVLTHWVASGVVV